VNSTIKASTSGEAEDRLQQRFRYSSGPAVAIMSSGLATFGTPGNTVASR
jgi:hypothetical protein